MRRRAAFTVLLAALSVAWPGHALGQESGQGALRVTGMVGGSLRDGLNGFGVARDVVNFSVRLSLPKGLGIQPWVQAGGFNRPDLICEAALPCNTEGWTLRGGVALPFSPDDSRPGVHPYMIGGIGAAFAEEDTFSWLLGIGTSYSLTPRLAPVFELRWEDLPGIRNVLMLNLGLRLDLF